MFCASHSLSFVTWRSNFIKISKAIATVMEEEDGEDIEVIAR